MRSPMKHSLINPVSKNEVVAEYLASSYEFSSFERAKWGSIESQQGRFLFALKKLDFSKMKLWLDLGCGEGDFFELAECNSMRFELMHGVDITPTMIIKAQEKTFSNPVQFTVSDLESLPESVSGYDLVTLIGVLQQCGMIPANVFKVINRTLKTNGILYLTTKNIDWDQFTSGILKPVTSHSWFDYQDLEKELVINGFEIVEAAGLDPINILDIPMYKSHTMYIIARKIRENNND